MENIKNFVHSITGSQKETHQNQTSFSGNSTNGFDHFIKMENIRPRTESESSEGSFSCFPIAPFSEKSRNGTVLKRRNTKTRPNASVSSISLNGSQKEMDNYFWVMYVITFYFNCGILIQE